MDGLETFDTEQLEAELARRKEEAERQAMPVPLDNPDWSVVTKYCKGYIEDLHTKGYTHTDDKQYIFEAAMNAVFGKNVWQWINAKQR